MILYQWCPRSLDYLCKVSSIDNDHFDKKRLAHLLAVELPLNHMLVVGPRKNYPLVLGLSKDERSSSELEDLNAFRNLEG